MTARNPNNLAKGEKVVKVGSPTVGTILNVTAWGAARVEWEGGAVTFPKLHELERVKEMPPWGIAEPVPHVQVDAFLTKFSGRPLVGIMHGPELPRCEGCGGSGDWTNNDGSSNGDCPECKGHGTQAPHPMAGRAWTPGMEIGNGIMNQIKKECDAEQQDTPAPGRNWAMDIGNPVMDAINRERDAERTPQRAATNAMLAAGVVPAHLAHGTPPPELSSPSWEQPGHPVYELAKRIFIIDNAKLDRARAAKDWDTINPLYRDYAFNIARGLLDAGFERKDMARDAAALEVVAAWKDAGPVPEAHRAAQGRLRHDWPVLAVAVDRLAGVNWRVMPAPSGRPVFPPSV